VRRALAALTIALLASSGFAATVQAAPANPKVVIVVGAVHGQTGTYLQRGERAYREARKYTSNVVKVFSPCATWSKVKAAMQGASVVIYMGHGNGFPSPYRSSPYAQSQNGMGLNATCNAGHSNTKYYGEYSISREVDLAPNAAVLLHHLCYASGNSEPGKPNPTTSVARQRVDNYAAGFLRAGARAVIADGHSDPDYYLWALFSTHQTIDELWRAAPNFHDHVITFASQRTAGYTARLDPDGAASGFYRSLVMKAGLRTDDVTGAPRASTGADPAWFVVPGAASVAREGAPLWASPALDGTSAPLAIGTRIRIDGREGPTAAGVEVLAVHILGDDQSGYMAAGDLVPRDSAGPAIWDVDAGSGAFSPNGDDSADTFALGARITEDASWRVTWSDGDGDVLATSTGNGDEVAATWDGLDGSAPVPDGTYRWEIVASDEWGNPDGRRTGDVVIDTVAPVLSVGADVAAAGRPMVTPNGDAWSESVSIAVHGNETGTIALTVRNDTGAPMARGSFGMADGEGAVSWNGRTTAGTPVANGPYRLEMTPVDRAGNVGDRVTAGVDSFSSLKALSASPSTFFPQDGDGLAKSAKVRFELLHPATVTWRIVNASGTVVRTIATDQALPAGPRSFTWNGRNDAGALVPQGRYVSRVTATDGTYESTVTPGVYATAFRMSSNDSTPARGQRITITVVTAEPLKKAPYLAVYQPGVKGWGVSMSRASTSTYRVTIKLKSGSTGTVKFKVAGVDSKGGKNQSYLRLPIH
jgi:flagellar hook assembly protein FlgD